MVQKRCRCLKLTQLATIHYFCVAMHLGYLLVGEKRSVA